MENYESEEVLRELRKNTKAVILTNYDNTASVYYTYSKEDVPLREYEHYDTYDSVEQAREVVKRLKLLKERDRWREAKDSTFYKDYPDSWL